MSRKRRVCEEQIIVFRSNSAEEAYAEAIRFGKSLESSECLDKKKAIYLHTEFIGVLDLVELFDWDDNAEFQEVWYDLYDKVLPMENRSRIIPPKERLREFYSGRKPLRGTSKLA